MWRIDAPVVRSRSDFHIRKAVELPAGEGTAEWLERLEENRIHSLEVGEKLWKRARSLKLKRNDKQSRVQNTEPPPKSPNDWVNDAAWQTLLEMYLFLAETNSQFSSRLLKQAVKIFSSFPPCVFFGEVGESQGNAIHTFSNFLMDSIHTGKSDLAQSTKSDPSLLCLAILELAVVRGSLSYILLLALKVMQGHLSLPTAGARSFQRILELEGKIEPEEPAVDDPLEWVIHLPAAVESCTAQGEIVTGAEAVLTLVAPLYILARRTPKLLHGKPLAAGCIEANLTVIGQLHELLVKVLHTNDSVHRGVCVCTILGLLQINLECLPLEMECGDMESAELEARNVTRRCVLVTLNKLSTGEGFSLEAMDEHLRTSIQLEAQACIAAGLSFFFRNHQEKIQAIVTRMHLAKKQEEELRNAIEGSDEDYREEVQFEGDVLDDDENALHRMHRRTSRCSVLSTESRLTSVPSGGMDMITGLLLDDVARPEMLADLLQASPPQEEATSTSSQPGQEERNESESSGGTLGRNGQPQLDDLLPLFDALTSHELRLVDDYFNSGDESLLHSDPENQCSLDPILNSMRIEECWTWDKFHAMSMEVSADGLSIKKMSDFPDFSNAMGSVAFSSGQHEWQVKINSVTRIWIGVANVENFELGEHPTCFRDVWLISSFGGRHPDSSGFGGSLSLETMFTTGDTVTLHLDLDEGILGFSKNGTFCENAKFTGLQGKTLSPVICMDNVGDSAVVVSRVQVTYPVQRRVLGPHAALFNLLSQLVAMLVSLQAPDNALRRAAVFGSQTLTRALCFVDALFSRLSKAVDERVSEDKVVALLDRSMVRELLPSLESLTWALLDSPSLVSSAGHASLPSAMSRNYLAFDSTNSSSGKANSSAAFASPVPLVITVDTLTQLERVYSSICVLVAALPALQSSASGPPSFSVSQSQKLPSEGSSGSSTAAVGVHGRRDASRLGRQDTSGDSGSGRHGQGKDAASTESRLFVAALQSEVGQGSQVVHMVLEYHPSESEAQRAQTQDDTAGGNRENGSEGESKEVVFPNAHYLLIEFDTQECTLDSRASLMVTSQGGACVAHLTGPAFCWPSKLVLVPGSSCKFQLRRGGVGGTSGAEGRYGTVAAHVTGYYAPPCPAGGPGWDVRPYSALLPLQAAKETRLPLRLHSIRLRIQTPSQTLNAIGTPPPSRLLSPGTDSHATRTAGGEESSFANTTGRRNLGEEDDEEDEEEEGGYDGPEVSSMASRLVELGVKCVLHSILEGLAMDQNDPGGSSASGTAELPTTSVSLLEVTPERVEHILRKVLPRSLHGPTLEECMACQRAHQLLLHSGSWPTLQHSNGLALHGSAPLPAPTASTAVVASQMQRVNHTSSAADSPTSPFREVHRPPSRRPSTISETDQSHVRMGIFALPADLLQADLLDEVVTVELVAEWCQAVCTGFTFQSETFTHLKGIVQHVAVEMIKLGSSQLSSISLSSSQPLSPSLSTSPQNASFQYAQDQDAPAGVLTQSFSLPASCSGSSSLGNGNMIHPEHIQRGLQGSALGDFLHPLLGAEVRKASSSHAQVQVYDVSTLLAHWCPPTMPPHWLPHHATMLAGLSGSVSAHLMKPGGPPPSPTAQPNARAVAADAVSSLLCRPPFTFGVQQEEDAVCQMLDAWVHGKSHSSEKEGPSGGEAWGETLLEWSVNACGGSSAPPQLVVAVHFVAVTLFLILTASTHPRTAFHPADLQQVFMQHLSATRVDLMGLKVQGSATYADLIASVRSNCVSLLRFTNHNSQTPHQTPHAPVEQPLPVPTPPPPPEGTSKVPVKKVANLFKVWVKTVQKHQREDLQAAVGELRSVILGSKAQLVLQHSLCAEGVTRMASDSLVAVVRMLGWSRVHAQTALDALLTGWSAHRHYLTAAMGASLQARDTLRQAAHHFMHTVITSLQSGLCKPTEASLVQALLRRLDGLDVQYLVEGTSLMGVVEHYLAIAGAAVDSGGVMGSRMWRLLCLLLLHLGPERATLPPSTVTRLLCTVRSVLHRALHQMYLGASRSLSGDPGVSNGRRPGLSGRSASEPLDHLLAVKDVFGTQCLKRLEVSSSESMLDMLMDTQNDSAWMPQDGAPHITFHVAQDLGLSALWLWIPSDRDGSRQATEIEVLGGQTVDSLQPMLRHTFSSPDEARAAFQPSNQAGLSGDFFLIVDGKTTPALARSPVVRLKFKQPLLQSRVFTFSLTEEDMYRLKIYGLRISARPLSALGPAGMPGGSGPGMSAATAGGCPGVRTQLLSLQEVCTHLLIALRESPAARICLRNTAHSWMQLFLRALKTPRALGSSSEGYISTHSLRLKVVHLLPYVLSAPLPESDMQLAYQALLDTVALCSPEALILPARSTASASASASASSSAAAAASSSSCSSSTSPPDSSMDPEASLQRKAAPTLRLRQALIAMLRSQIMGKDLNSMPVKVLCQRMDEACTADVEEVGGSPGKWFNGSPQKEARVVHGVLPAVLLLGGFTDALLASVPSSTSRPPSNQYPSLGHSTYETPTFAVPKHVKQENLPSGTGSPSSSFSVPNNSSNIDPALTDSILRLCERVLPPHPQPSLAHRFLRARLAKALWELLACPSFAQALAEHSDLLSHLLSAASRSTRVPLGASIESLAARSIALCVFFSDASCTRASEGFDLQRIFNSEVLPEDIDMCSDSPTSSRPTHKAGTEAGQSSTARSGNMMQMASRPASHSQASIFHASIEMDSSLLLQATPEPEVLMQEDPDTSSTPQLLRNFFGFGVSQSSIDLGMGSGGGASSGDPNATGTSSGSTSWLDQALQGVPLQTDTPDALLHDLATAENALFVYYSRQVLLQLLSQIPSAASRLLGGSSDLLGMLRPLFLCSGESLSSRVPQRCPRPLVRTHANSQHALQAADKLFHAWLKAATNIPHKSNDHPGWVVNALSKDDYKIETDAEGASDPGWSPMRFLHALCVREIDALRPPVGGGLEECIHSVVVESPHDYKNRSLFARKLTFPEAASLQVTFHPRCSTEKKCDFLMFFAHEEDWRNSKPPLKTCDGPSESSCWRTPLLVNGSSLVYSFHSDKRNTDWGYHFTVTGLNKWGTVRATRSFTLEGVHPGKERSFSGGEFIHVQTGTEGTGTPPALQLQFHPTCTVEKPDQQLLIGGVAYSGPVGSATWPLTALHQSSSFNCSFTCTKQKSCVFKWRVSVQPAALPAQEASMQVTEATASTAPHITAAPFLHYLLRNMLSEYPSPSTSSSNLAALSSLPEQPTHSPLLTIPSAGPGVPQEYYFQHIASCLMSLVVDPKLTPCMRTLVLRSLAQLARCRGLTSTSDTSNWPSVSSNAQDTNLPLFSRLQSSLPFHRTAPQPIQSTFRLPTVEEVNRLSRQLWRAAQAQYNVERRSIGTHACFASPLLSALCEAACAIAGEFGLPLQQQTPAVTSSANSSSSTHKAAPIDFSACRGISPETINWLQRDLEVASVGNNAAGVSGSNAREDSNPGRSMSVPGGEEAAWQREYCQLWELMYSMTKQTKLPSWVKEEVLRSLSKGDTAVWGLPIFEKAGDGCTITSHSVTFSRRCTVLCNRPMNQNTGVYSCEFKIDEGRQILVGVAMQDCHLETYLGDDPHKLAYGYMNSGRIRSLSSWTSHRLDNFDEGDVITVKLDTNNAKLTFCKNGSPVGMEETMTQWPLVFACGGSRMGAATIINAMHDGSPGAEGERAASSNADLPPPAFLTSPLALLDNTDGWNLAADGQLLTYAAERAADKKLTLMQLNPDDLFNPSGRDAEGSDVKGSERKHSSTSQGPVDLSSFFADQGGSQSSLASSPHGSSLPMSPLSSFLRRDPLFASAPASPKVYSTHNTLPSFPEGWALEETETGDLDKRHSVSSLSNEPTSEEMAQHFKRERTPSLPSRLHTSPFASKRPMWGEGCAGRPSSLRSRRSITAQLSAANRFQALVDKPQEALKARFAVLQLYNKLCRVCLPFIADSWLGQELHANKLRLFPETKAQCHDLALSLTALQGTVPSVSINRVRASARCNKKHTVFRQLYDKLEGHSMRTTQHSSMLWHVSFEGEGGIDQGGLFRESLMEMSKELHSSAMQLFVECPNKRRSQGRNMDKCVPNPACTSALDRQMYRFLGAVMGGMIRTKNVLALDLPPIFWKQLLRDPTTLADLAHIDDNLVRFLERVRSPDSEERWAEATGNQIHYVVEDVRGRVRPLPLNPSFTEEGPPPSPSTMPSKVVTFQERDYFCQALVQFRLNEFNFQISAIREGLLRAVPELVLSLMTWRELEMAVCGKPEIDIEVLKQMTTVNLPENCQLVDWLWSVLHSFTNKDRAAFLAFACGRSRLPVRGSGTVLTVNLDPSKGDAHCPTSHTCTLTIDLPAYSSEEVLGERLIYAIHNCREIDTDFVARDFSARDFTVGDELVMDSYDFMEAEMDEEEEQSESTEDPNYFQRINSFGITMSEMDSAANRYRFFRRIQATESVITQEAEAEHSGYQSTLAPLRRQAVDITGRGGASSSGVHAYSALSPDGDGGEMEPPTVEESDSLDSFFWNAVFPGEMLNEEDVPFNESEIQERMESTGSSNDFFRQEFNSDGDFPAEDELESILAAQLDDFGSMV